jgi:magnesium transporter
MTVAGEMRVSDFLRRDVSPLSWRMTVGEALASLRARPLGERIVYFYVVDDEGRLIGVVPTRRLLMASPDARIADVMVRDVVALPASATLRDAADFFLAHKLLALPVVDAEGGLDGVVDIGVFTGEISNFAARQSANDAFEIIGARVAAQTGAWRGFTDRFPWLLCNVGGGMAAALIAAAYQPVLEAVIALALFIPVALTVSESVAMQSVTLTLQHLHGAPADARFLFKTLRRELATAALLGALRRGDDHGRNGGCCAPRSRPARNVAGHAAQPTDRLGADRAGADRRADARLLLQHRAGRPLIRRPSFVAFQ